MPLPHPEQLLKAVKQFIRRCQFTGLFYWSRSGYHAFVWRFRNDILFSKRKTLGELGEDSAKLFAPRITPSQRGQITVLMETLHQLLEANGCFYSLSYGSLLGAILYDDMIPWDDDMDIFCKEEDKTLILSQLAKSGLAYREIPMQQRIMGKPCYLGKVYDPKHPNWPFIDIAWLHPLDETYWLDTSNHQTFLATDFLYRYQHPFGALRLWISPNIMLNEPQALDYALPPNINHIQDAWIEREHFKVKLSELADRYPVLQEQPSRKLALTSSGNGARN